MRKNINIAFTLYLGLKQGFFRFSMRGNFNLELPDLSSLLVCGRMSSSSFVERKLDWIGRKWTRLGNKVQGLEGSRHPKKYFKNP